MPTAGAEIEALLANDTDGTFRRGLHSHDLTRYVIATAMGMLLNVIPDIGEPEVARK